ncbi:MAG: hypothetical protein A3D31_04820 [Candidatus Fluviicola riflensis]|nr:MAG: hypothetical protein CHH17_10200 [Candidatus Fluviicola riflensis]OGS79299.1 MAG: hypothetical protein A3D31_04820 [Candidatus Fluviicola riflensis]OGS86731.1 MAG: hypothetical protein A2724_04280 [Fluviicola sp. RIFCSPHIGHO2_01_FULL_43_53]OGS88795.1 MAG: hypothetical protein A3E30_00380 [Fluviicola sp. RIFCSPHIGHO2_12_FULL_43_24]
MKKFLLLLALSSASFANTQQLVELGANPISSDGYHAEYTKIRCNNLGTPFTAYIKQGKLFVDRFVANVWEHTEGASGAIDSLVKCLDFDYNPVNNQFYLLYTKSDGVYFKTYTNTWSATSYYPVVISGGAATSCMMAVDHTNNIPYTIFREGNDAILWKKYDFSTDSFDSIPAPVGFSDYQTTMISTDIEVNQATGDLFAAFQSTGLQAMITKYNGNTWSDLDNAVTIDQISRLKLGFKYGATNELILGMNYNNGNGYYMQVKKYNTTSGLGSTIQTPVNYGYDYASMLYGLAVSPVNNYISYAFNKFSFPVAPLLRYNTGSNSWTSFNHNLDDHTFYDVYYNQTGDLFLATTSDSQNTLHIYKMDYFSLDVNEHEETTLATYPNPVNESFEFDAKENGKAIIYTTEGQVVRSATITAGNHTFIVNDLPAACYVVLFTGDSGIMTRTKIIKL